MFKNRLIEFGKLESLFYIYKILLNIYNLKITMQTKVTKLLDQKGINYRLLPHAKQVFTCEDAARERKVPLDQMIKCMLLVDASYEYSLVCCTADKRVDLKRVQGLLNSQRLNLASKEEIESILGYTMGAIPPLLLKTEIKIVFDRLITETEKVNISSGNPSAGLELSPKDLISITNPVIGNVSE